MPTQVQIIYDNGVRRGKVPGNMGKFVEQAKPEIVETIISKRHADNGSSVRPAHSGPVQIGLRKMRYKDKMNPVFFQIFLGQQGSVVKITELCNFPHEFEAHSALPMNTVK